MKFGYVVQNSIYHALTVEICKIIIVEGENKSRDDSTSGGFNPFSVSLTFGNSIGTVRGKKLEESQGTARDAAIAGWRHVSPLRGKGWVIHNWELVRTCVGILRDINWNEFWGVFAIFILSL